MSRWWLMVATMVLALACTGTGVGPSPTESRPPTTVSSTTTTTLLPVEAGVEGFVTCLADSGLKGVEIPIDALGRPRLDLALPLLDTTDPATVAALGACGEHLSTGALDTSSDSELGALVNRALADFSECVRSRGVPDFPDPVEGFVGVGAPYPLAEIPYTDEDLPAAVEECQARMGPP